MRSIVVLVAAVALSACGSAQEEGRPAVRALDRPAPTEFTAELRSLPTALATFPRSAKKQALLGIVPESDPRVVAELELGRGTVRLYAWTAQAGRLCLWETVITPEEPEGYGGPLGPCLTVQPCGRVCVVQQQLDAGTTLVAGAVAAEADSLRLVGSRGPAIELELDGPLIPRFPGWRVVIAHLGRRSYGSAELFLGSERIARIEDAEYDYATEECFERAGEDERAREKCL